MSLLHVTASAVAAVDAEREDATASNDAKPSASPIAGPSRARFITILRSLPDRHGDRPTTAAPAVDAARDVMWRRLTGPAPRCASAGRPARAGRPRSTARGRPA